MPGTKKGKRSKKGKKKASIKKKVRMEVKRSMSKSRPFRAAAKKINRKINQRRAGIVSTPTTGLPVVQGSVQRQMGPLINRSRGVVVRHTEYLDEVKSTVNFANDPMINQYAINAGLISSFPWLGAMAGLFESYEFKRLTWIIETNAPTTETGWIGMATQVDPVDAPFTGVQDLMGYKGSISGPVWKSLRHNSIIAGRKALFVRTTDPPPSGTDIRMYDYGTFTFATQGAVSNGKMWGKLMVDYEVVLYTPKVNLAGSLNFWRNYTTVSPAAWPVLSGTGYTFPLDEAVQDFNSFGAAYTTTDGNAPYDFITIGTDLGLDYIQFNYPGLYNWAYSYLANISTDNFLTSDFVDSGSSSHQKVLPVVETWDSKGIVGAIRYGWDTAYAYLDTIADAIQVITNGQNAGLIETTVQVALAGARFYFEAGGLAWGKILGSDVRSPDPLPVILSHIITMLNPSQVTFSALADGKRYIDRPFTLTAAAKHIIESKYIKAVDKAAFDKNVRVVPEGPTAKVLAKSRQREMDRKGKVFDCRIEASVQYESSFASVEVEMAEMRKQISSMSAALADRLDAKKLVPSDAVIAVSDEEKEDPPLQADEKESLKGRVALSEPLVFSSRRQQGVPPVVILGKPSTSTSRSPSKDREKQ